MSATIEVGTWYSRCSACGENADPYETAHVMETMVGEGCGATYTAITSQYLFPGVSERMREMRPDLPLAGWVVEFEKIHWPGDGEA